MAASAPVARLLERLGLEQLAPDWAASAGDVRTAWSACRRPDLMVAIAARAGVERRAVVRAAARVVELGLPVALREPVAARALEIAVRWSHDDVSREEVRAALSVTTYLAGRLAVTSPATGAVLAAIATLVSACDPDVPAEEWTDAATAAVAVRIVLEALPVSLHPAGAQRVREELPWRVLQPAAKRALRASKPSGIHARDPDEDTPIARRAQKR